MYTTPKGTYFSNLKRAWKKTSLQTRSILYTAAGFTFVIVLMFSLLGITSIKNAKLQADIDLLQITNGELQFENDGLWHYYQFGELPPKTAAFGVGSMSQGMNYSLVKIKDTW